MTSGGRTYTPSVKGWSGLDGNRSSTTSHRGRWKKQHRVNQAREGKKAVNAATRTEHDTTKQLAQLAETGLTNQPSNLSHELQDVPVSIGAVKRCI